MKANVPPGPKVALTPSWDLLPKSTNLVVQHFTAVMYLFLLPGLLSVLGQLLIGKHIVIKPHLELTTQQMWGLACVGVSLVWTIINLGPSMYFQLRAVSGKSETIGTYYKRGLQFTPRILGFEILLGLMVVVGFILLIVPGLLILQRFILADYYLVDSNCSIKTAFKRSGQDTKSKPISGAVWGVLGVTFVFIFIAGFVADIPLLGPILSELATFPCLFLLALRYREIRPKAL